MAVVYGGCMGWTSQVEVVTPLSALSMRRFEVGMDDGQNECEDGITGVSVDEAGGGSFFSHHPGGISRPRCLSFYLGAGAAELSLCFEYFLSTLVTRWGKLDRLLVGRRHRRRC